MPAISLRVIGLDIGYMGITQDFSLHSKPNWYKNPSQHLLQTTMSNDAADK
jgi:hypothetical protein